MDFFFKKTPTMADFRFLVHPVVIDNIYRMRVYCVRWGERCIRSVNTDLDLDTAHRTWDDHRCWLRAANSLVCKLALD